MTVCGYCIRPMTGRQCEHCAPALAEISDTTEWVLFARRARRDPAARRRSAVRRATEDKTRKGR